MAPRLTAVARGFALGLLALLLGLLAWKLTHPAPGAAFVKQVAAGEQPPAPKLELPVLMVGNTAIPAALRSALREGRVSTGDLRGQPVVVNFFASYCGPCRDEAQLLARSADRLTGRVVFVGVAYQDFRADARRLVNRSGGGYPVLFDGPGDTANDWGLTGIPETFVLNADGRVVRHLVGRLSAAELSSAVTAALAHS